jgi:hypothetical protein
VILAPLPMSSTTYRTFATWPTNTMTPAVTARTGDPADVAMVTPR